MTITREEIAEWDALRGEGMVSAVGEYTPEPFWRLLDAHKRTRGMLDAILAECEQPEEAERPHGGPCACEGCKGWDHVEAIRESVEAQIALLEQATPTGLPETFEVVGQTWRLMDPGMYMRVHVGKITKGDEELQISTGMNGLSVILETPWPHPKDARHTAYYSITAKVQDAAAVLFDRREQG